MKIHILTLFPRMFDSFLTQSIIKRAIAKKVVAIDVHDLRDFTHDRHKTCDDRPFGGGPGMLLKPEPIFQAVRKLLGKTAGTPGAQKKCRRRLVYLSPQGRRLDQRTAKRLASYQELIFLCGHYEGVDQRVIDELVHEEISIGDYVLTGGELPAMVVTDAVVRLLPGAIGCEKSSEFESFSQNLLEYPQYTRPAVYDGRTVPEVLLSGNHKRIEEWRTREAYRRTRRRRPDLLRKRKSTGVKS